jgi:hypothetical protein
MPYTPQYTALGTLTLSSGQSSVTFSNIPSAYRDLQIVVSYAMSGTGSASRLRFNGDSGYNYSSVGVGGQGSVEGGWTEANATGARVIGYSVGPTTGQQNFTLSVFDYSVTNKHKYSLSRMNDAGGDVMATSTRWGSTSVINSVTIFDVLGQNFVAGSTFSLYGVK